MTILVPIYNPVTYLTERSTLIVPLNCKRLLHWKQLIVVSPDDQHLLHGKCTTPAKESSVTAVQLFIISEYCHVFVTNNRPEVLVSLGIYPCRP
jgi:hypothetical protein